MTQSVAQSSGRGLRVVISGGGTGGHLFPALAIARQLQLEDPRTEVMFVGAHGRMEMEKVPAHGYRIKGLWIAGMVRGAVLKNLLLPFKVIVSIVQAWWLLTRFKPDIAIGTGGFASAPLLYEATLKGIPTLIQEQNFYPGLTNRLLAKSVDRVCGVYEELSQYFGSQKLVITGNPVREALKATDHTAGSARTSFGLAADKPTFLVIGGSLGATTLNQAITAILPDLADDGIQGIWQTGPDFYQQNGEQWQSQYGEAVKVQAFIEDMSQAYKAADLVICRAGAITLAELAYLGKAAMLVPSPNVAADHQTKNAQVLEAHQAAILVPDNEAERRIPAELPDLLKDQPQLAKLAEQIRAFARPAATQHIVEEVFSLAGKSFRKDSAKAVDEQRLTSSVNPKAES